MDNTTQPSNTKIGDAELTGNITKIPKVNMRFDGSSWTNQSVSPDSISDTKNVGNPSLLPEEAKASPKSSGSNDDTDHEFEYEDSADNLYDDEETVDEEEAIDDGEGDIDELNDLEKESAIPLSELFAFYCPKENDTAEYNSIEENQPNSNENKNDDNDSDDNEDLTRQLRSSTSFLSPNHHQSGDEEEDRDYVPPSAEDWKKPPRVGEKYQVPTENIPDTKHQSPDYNLAEDQLVWDPTSLDEDKVKNYLTLLGHEQSDAGLFPVPSNSHLRDNEDALFLLTQCNNDVDEAVIKFRQRPPNLVNDLTAWTEEECRKFELGLTTYGKDFHSIRLNYVKHRTIGEIVKFYYIWKKTERYDLFNAKTRLGKKKDTMHPGVTDYMERLLDETEHSIVTQQGPQSNAPNASYPLPLSHTAALQQHLAEARAKHQNRDPNAYDSESSSAEYLAMNGLADGDYQDEMDIPTFNPNPIYPPASFVPIDPVVIPARSGPSRFVSAPTNHHPGMVSVGAFPTNQNNNSHVAASPNPIRDPFEATDSVSVPPGGTVPVEVLSSINALENSYRNSVNINQSAAPTTYIASVSSDPPVSIDSPSERPPTSVNLKRFQSPAGVMLAKKSKFDDPGSSDSVPPPFQFVSRDCPELPTSSASSDVVENSRC